MPNLNFMAVPETNASVDGDRHGCLPQWTQSAGQLIKMVNLLQAHDIWLVMHNLSQKAWPTVIPVEAPVWYLLIQQLAMSCCLSRSQERFIPSMPDIVQTGTHVGIQSQKALDGIFCCHLNALCAQCRVMEY